MDTYDVEYACLFCRVGSELAVAGHLEQSVLHLRACAVQVIERRTFQGITTSGDQAINNASAGFRALSNKEHPPSPNPQGWPLLGQRRFLRLGW